MPRALLLPSRRRIARALLTSFVFWLPTLSTAQTASSPKHIYVFLDGSGSMFDPAGSRMPTGRFPVAVQGLDTVLKGIGADSSIDLSVFVFGGNSKRLDGFDFRRRRLAEILDSDHNGRVERSDIAALGVDTDHTDFWWPVAELKEAIGRHQDEIVSFLLISDARPGSRRPKKELAELARSIENVQHRRNVSLFLLAFGEGLRERFAAFLKPDLGEKVSTSFREVVTDRDVDNLSQTLIEWLLNLEYLDTLVTVDVSDQGTSLAGLVRFAGNDSAWSYRVKSARVAFDVEGREAASADVGASLEIPAHAAAERTFPVALPKVLLGQALGTCRSARLRPAIHLQVDAMGRTFERIAAGREKDVPLLCPAVEILSWDPLSKQDALDARRLLALEELVGYRVSYRKNADAPLAVSLDVSFGLDGLAAPLDSESLAFRAGRHTGEFRFICSPLLVLSALASGRAAGSTTPLVFGLSTAGERVHVQRAKLPVALPRQAVFLEDLHQERVHVLPFLVWDKVRYRYSATSTGSASTTRTRSDAVRSVLGFDARFADNPMGDSRSGRWSSCLNPRVGRAALEEPYVFLPTDASSGGGEKLLVFYRRDVFGKGLDGLLHQLPEAGDAGAALRDAGAAAWTHLRPRRMPVAMRTTRWPSPLLVLLVSSIVAAMVHFKLKRRGVTGRAVGAGEHVGVWLLALVPPLLAVAVAVACG